MLRQVKSILYLLFCVGGMVFCGVIQAPLWAYAIFLLGVGVFALSGWQDSRTQKGWKALAEAYELKLERSSAIVSPGVDILTGSLNEHGLQIRLSERDLEGGQQPDLTHIRLECPLPERSRLLDCDAWDVLKDDLDRVYGLQYPALSNDPVMPGDEWKQASYPQAVDRRSERNRNRKSQLSWGDGGLSIFIEIEHLPADQLATIIDNLSNLTIALDASLSAEITEEPPMKSKKKEAILLAALLGLARQGDRARLCARIQAEFVGRHPVNAAGGRAYLYEAVGDRVLQTDAVLAGWLYDKGIEDLRIFASGASGQGDGRSRMADVEALVRKRAALG